jgi:hypothetical protein
LFAGDPCYNGSVANWWRNPLEADNPFKKLKIRVAGKARELARYRAVRDKSKLLGRPGAG